MKRLKKFAPFIIGALALASGAYAQDPTAMETFATNVAGMGTEIAGYVVTALGGGLTVAVLFLGARLTIKGFRTVAK